MNSRLDKHEERIGATEASSTNTHQRLDVVDSRLSRLEATIETKFVPKKVYIHNIANGRRKPKKALTANIPKS